jgi:uncharacterized membrane protein YeaQ/YmgE (transglycosylase-associated protein family)
VTDTSITSRIAVPHTGTAQFPPTGGSAVIGFLVAGLVIGALARLIVPGKQHLGILATLALGLDRFAHRRPHRPVLRDGSIWELNVIGFVLAVVAAVLLIGVAEGVAGRSRGQVR